MSVYDICIDVCDISIAITFMCFAFMCVVYTFGKTYLIFVGEDKP